MDNLKVVPRYWPVPFVIVSYQEKMSLNRSILHHNSKAFEEFEFKSLIFISIKSKYQSIASEY